MSIKVNGITKIIPLYTVPPDNKDLPESPRPLDEYFKRKCHSAADLIGQAFAWSETEEGDAFWRSVYDRLIALSDGESTKAHK